MDEADSKIDSYDYQLDRIEQQLSHTIGYKRNALIQEYNSLNSSRKKFVYAYNLANDKRNKRIRQYKSYAAKYDDQCVDVTVSRVDLEEVCSGRGGFCSSFD
ncbi:hypothetical protein [Desulfosediminicola flagellatus]|uniref:hypothetical protein n=1 Tax=Desulfosediminicola flagellatus TaxID=2569541 RepID=UPI0010AD1368|nr:hypothetical protein [Desulfosediminicola flagellatus]